MKVIHILEEDLEEIDLSGLPQNPTRDDMFKIYAQFYEKGQQKNFHETYHLWQGIRLPYLQRHAVCKLMLMRFGLNKFLEHNKDYRNWQAYLGVKDVYELNEEGQFSIGDQGIIYEAPKKNRFFMEGLGRRTDTVTELFSAIDLLEAATTMAEFQYCCNEIVDAYDPLKFERWIKRNPGNVKVYRFVSEYLGKSGAIAIRIFIHLINAAFHTTDPLRAFATLLVRFSSGLSFSDSNEIKLLSFEELQPWKPLFTHYLRSLTYDVKPNNWHQLQLADSFQLLDLRKFDNTFLREDGSKVDVHQVLTPLLRKWLEKEDIENQDSWGSVLDCPIALKHEIDRWLTMDTLSIIKFNIHQVKTPVILYTHNKDGILDSDAIQELYGVMGVFRRATGENYDEESRLCAHDDCPQYKANYCGSFVKIPIKFEDCKFPEFADRWFKTNKER
ncbi:MAG TPA: hypothetical protein VGM63_05460 [Mucilaginibacter sp.]